MYFFIRKQGGSAKPEISNFGRVVCLIFYLWIFKEIDESILSIEIQNATARSLKNEIDVIKNDLEKLNRADVITSRARSELNMVIASPETLIVSMNKILASDLWQNPTQSTDTE